jgi:hypothetical protein
VIPDHSKAFFREGALALEDVVEILRPGVNDPFGGFLMIRTDLIVTPWEHDIIETAMRLIDTVFCRINLVVGVWVCRECLWIYDFVWKAASDDECVLDGEKRRESSSISMPSPESEMGE